MFIPIIISAMVWRHNKDTQNWNNFEPMRKYTPTDTNIVIIKEKYIGDVNLFSTVIWRQLRLFLQVIGIHK